MPLFQINIPNYVLHCLYFNYGTTSREDITLRSWFILLLSSSHHSHQHTENCFLSVSAVIFSCKGTIRFRKISRLFYKFRCLCQKRNEPLPNKHPASNNCLPRSSQNKKKHPAWVPWVTESNHEQTLLPII